MIPYILHVSILIAAGLLFYRLALKKLTFYVLNRWVLLSCLAIAFLLPLVPVPRGWSWHGPIIAAAAPEKKLPSVVIPAATMIPTDVAPPSRRTSSARTTVASPRAAAVTSGTAAVSSRAAAARTVDVFPAFPIKPVTSTTPTNISNKLLLPRILQALFYLYLIGAAVLGLNLLRQMVLLFLQSYKGPVIRDGQFRIITTAGMHSPCSFGNTIFIHPHRYDPDTYHQILLHEKIHAGGWHTVDILLAELGVVFQWFNPFIWLFRREMENNLEFLTDRNVLKNPGIERSAYQLSLVKVAAPDMPLSITSNYNQSLLKRRIIMMNAQNSARHTAWKYFFLLPIFIILAGMLNRPSAQSSGEKDRVSSSAALPKKTKQPAPTAPAVTPGAAAHAADTTHSDEPAVPVVVDVHIPLGDPQPSMSPNPTPMVSVSAAPQPEINPALSPLSNMDTSMPSSQVDRSEGAWFIVNSTDKKDEKVRIELRSNNYGNDWTSSFSVDRNQLVNFSSVGKVDFSLKRDAGTIHFTGQFDGEQGFGHYKFQADADYLTHMREKKIVDDEGELVPFFMVDVKKGYVDMLQANGFPDVTRHRVISMAALGIDETYIKSIRESGYSDLSENQLISLKALHIDKAFIDDLRKAGYDHLDIQKLISFKAMKVDGDYVRRFPSGTRAQDIITYKSLNIDSAYVASLKRMGYTDLASHEIVTLRSMKVDAEYIKGFNDIGYKDIPVHSLTSFKSMNITPEYVKDFQALGYKDISPSHLVSLKAMKITPEFIKAFNSIGFKDIPLNQLSSLKATGITPDYVTRMKEKGFVSDDLNKYIRLKNAFD